MKLTSDFDFDLDEQALQGVFGHGTWFLWERMRVDSDSDRVYISVGCATFIIRRRCGSRAVDNFVALRVVLLLAEEDLDVFYDGQVVGFVLECCSLPLKRWTSDPEM